MKTWLLYGGSSALLVGLGGTAANLLEPSAASAVWVGLGLAWMVQILAFAILLGVVSWRPRLIVAGWTAGTFIRLLALSLIAWLSLSRNWAFPADTTLIATVVGFFGLLLLEPVMFHVYLRSR